MKIKKYFRAFLKFIFISDYRFLILARKGCFKKMDDEKFLTRMFKCEMHYPLNLDNPKSFNEKLQWLKLHNRNPIYTNLVDKIKVRDFIRIKIGEQYLIPLIEVWDKPEDIDFSKLPNKFVIKCNHNAGYGMVICKDKTKLNTRVSLNKIKKGFKHNYFYAGREWPYKHVERKILCEEYMQDDLQDSLIDYKILCFSGEPKLVEVHMGRFTNHTQDMYDIKWNKLKNFKQPSAPNSNIELDKPKCFDEMLSLTKILCKGMPHVRVDWYIINNRPYFGEMTFFDGSGFCEFEKYEDDITIGDWIKLSL